MCCQAFDYFCGFSVFLPLTSTQNFYCYLGNQIIYFIIIFVWSAIYCACVADYYAADCNNFWLKCFCVWLSNCILCTVRNRVSTTALQKRHPPPIPPTNISVCHSNTAKVVMAPCEFKFSSTALIANQTCSGNSTTGARWMEPNDDPCNFSMTARRLCQLARVGLSIIIITYIFDLYISIVVKHISRSCWRSWQYHKSDREHRVHWSHNSSINTRQNFNWCTWRFWGECACGCLFMCWNHLQSYTIIIMFIFSWQWGI